MITLIIVGITILVSIMAMDKPELKNKLMFNAYMINQRKEWYRFFSNGLIHADWIHLLLNMYVLWMFGRGVETMYKFESVYAGKGVLFFILLYIGGLVMSSLYSYERHKNDIYYNSLGASGAVSAVMFAYIVLAPTTPLGLMFLPGIQIPAYLFGLIILSVEHYLSKRGNTGIAHDAHFWGAIFGVVFTIALKPSLAVDFIHKIQGTD
jgi:membrane associated rhomboid family serine protease